MNLTLGDIEFQGFEIPSKLNGLGGIHQLAVTNLIGSGKVVQSLGPKPHPITWEGTFLYQEAFKRARQVDYYRIQGDEVTLTYGDYYADVVVREFKYDPAHEFEIPYSIVIEVVTDRTQPLKPDIKKKKDEEMIDSLQTSDRVCTNLNQDPNFSSMQV